MTNIGIEIRDVTLHEKDGKRWINLPSKPYEKEDGSQGWAYIVKFYEKDLWEKFQAEVLKSINAQISG
jgi:hypothetical protein